MGDSIKIKVKPNRERAYHIIVIQSRNWHTCSRDIDPIECWTTRLITVNPSIAKFIWTARTLRHRWTNPRICFALSYFHIRNSRYVAFASITFPAQNSIYMNLKPQLIPTIVI